MTDGELFSRLPEMLNCYPNGDRVGSHLYHKAVREVLDADNPVAELEQIVASLALAQSCGR